MVKEEFATTKKLQNWKNGDFSCNENNFNLVKSHKSKFAATSCQFFVAKK